MDATAELEQAVVALQNVLITRYVSAAGFVLLLYDHLLTLGDEVEYTWNAPNSVAKITFLCLRYMVPSFLTVQTVLRSGLSVIPMSDTVRTSQRSMLQHDLTLRQACKAWIPVATYAGWLSIAISNFLVLLRIWTTLPHSHRLKVWSIGFFAAAQILSFGFTSWVVGNMVAVLFFDSRVGLCSFSSKPNVVGLWVVGLAYEVLVFVTVCWNTLDRPRALRSSADAGVTRMLFKDGITYFVILFALRIANTVIAIVSPVSSLFVIVFFIWAATTVTTSRLILNSRRALDVPAQPLAAPRLVLPARSVASTSSWISLPMPIQPLAALSPRPRSYNLVTSGSWFFPPTGCEHLRLNIPADVDTTLAARSPRLRSYTLWQRDLPA
ncbi:hypothetical protein MSAN_00762800 [Mycena sanguinolenta]|uniref:DUF6533 domain-containing protein n=1 Tax=Mycena sanguinolenta TaxID=230812 RepID=A0A8H6Z8Q8_9AGAR|nr:hypothetical protein MSAN_00762800 [Mycena sanguinolenta]